MRPTLLLLILAACGGSDMKLTLSRLDPAGDACPSGGGVVTSTGVDDDGDGVLDAGEVDGTTTLCAADLLTRVIALAPGEICPGGGTSIQAGGDDDRDGVLDDTEVDTTQNICKGSLTRTVALGPEGPACFGLGGVRLDTGVDDDADNVLDDEEVDTSTVRCHDVEPTPVPGGEPGTAEIILDGGDSVGGAGGRGGDVRITHPDSGGGVALFRTGVVDASFVMPTRDPVLGARPLSVAADLVVPHATTIVGLVTGQAFTTDSHVLRVFMGGATPDDPANPRITSVTVAAGVTLTFGTGDVFLPDDFVNGGTVTRTPGPANTRTLTLEARAYVGLPGSRIDLSGTAGVASAGGVLRVTGEVVLNEGEILTTGAANATGAVGGGVFLTGAGGGVYNRGAITTNGGEATNAAQTGGVAGQVRLEGAGVWNSGTIHAFGGIGTRQGGAGGVIRLFGDGRGVRSSGELESRGGGLTGCTSLCRGGNGNSVQLTASGGPLLSSSPIVSRGASVTAADGCGGSGGTVTLQANGPFPAPGQGTIRLSGAIDTSGGSGGASSSNPPCSNATGGGGGGGLTVRTDPLLPLGQEVLLFGYARVRSQGGDGGGALTAGRGGSLEVRTSGLPLAGRIRNHVPLESLGGTATGAGTGGTGGSINLFADEGVLGGGRHTVENHAALSADGGPGGGGGHSFGILLYGSDGVTNTGDMSAIGGAGAVTSGGSSSGITLSALVGTTSNTASFNASGGAGAGAGGGGLGGRICLEGTQVTSAGVLTAVGGNATGANVNGNGGDAVVLSVPGPSVFTGTAALAAGTGGIGGSAGQLRVDIPDGRCFTFEE